MIRHFMKRILTLNIIDRSIRDWRESSRIRKRVGRNLDSMTLYRWIEGLMMIILILVSLIYNRNWKWYNNSSRVRIGDNSIEVDLRVRVSLRMIMETYSYRIMIRWRVIRSRDRVVINIIQWILVIVNRWIRSIYQSVRI